MSSGSWRSPRGARCSPTRSTRASTCSSPKCSATSRATARTTSPRSCSRCCSRWAARSTATCWTGYWQDIGNLEQFRQANFDALDGRVRLDVPGLQPARQRLGRARRSTSTRSRASWGRRSSGELPDRGQRVDRAVLGALAWRHRAGGDARCPEHRRRGDVPRPDSVVEGAIIGRGCDVRDHVRVHEGVAIGDQVTIGLGGEHLPGRPGLPVQGDRDRCPDPRERRLGDAGGDLAVRSRRRNRAGQRRSHARDGGAAGGGARHGASSRQSRRRESRVRRRVPHDPARDHLRAHLDRGPRRRSADLAGCGHAPCPEDAGPPGGRARRACQQRPGDDQRARLRVAREPDDVGLPEGGREALQPPELRRARSRRWGRRPTRRGCARATRRTSSTRSTSPPSGGGGSASPSTTATRPRRSRCRSSSARSASRRSARGGSTPTTGPGSSSRSTPGAARPGAGRAGRDGLAVLIDEQQPLGRPVEHDPEIRPHAGDDAAGVDRLELPGPVVGVEPPRADRLDAERAEDERQRERRGRVAVVEDHAEPPPPARRRRRTRRGCPARSPRAPAPGSSARRSRTGTLRAGDCAGV